MLHDEAITSKRGESRAMQRNWMPFLMYSGHEDHERTTNA